MNLRIYLLFIPFLIFFGSIKAQESAHIFGIGLGHSHVAKGEVNGQKRWLTLPSWTLDYSYLFNEKWGIGLHNDLILESFFVETTEEKIIEREFPVSPALVGIYKPSERWSIVGGVGAEIAQPQSLMLTRLAVEYAISINEKWEAGIAATWDGKWGYYNSWGLAITINRVWRKN